MTRAKPFYHIYRTKLIGFALAGFSALVWGSTFVSTKTLLSSFSPFEILFIRYALGYACLWVLFPRPLKPRRKKHELLFAGAGLAGITLYQFMENTALFYTQASNVSIIVSTAPLWTAALVSAFAGRSGGKKDVAAPRIGGAFIAGFVTAICGVVLIAFNGAFILKLSPRGDILALCSGISWGFYSLLIKKINALGYPTLASTRRMFFYALLFMIPLGFFTHVSLDAARNAARLSNPVMALNLLFLGVAASALCFASWNKASKMLGVIETSVFIYVIPAVTVAAAVVFIRERVTMFSIAGMILTMAGLYISLKGGI
ncbi:MAG: DMT family transporter [Treponemataceae bacterium]|nr:MAG: DMT family transporter [Treponemataceae bacterium]